MPDVRREFSDLNQAREFAKSQSEAWAMFMSVWLKPNSSHLLYCVGPDAKAPADYIICTY